MGEYDENDPTMGMGDMMQDPFEDYDYETLAQLYEEHKHDPEIAQMLLYGMQQKMQEARGQGGRNFGNKFVNKAVKIDEMLETRRCVESTYSQSVKIIGGLLLCVLLFRLIKYLLFRFLPKSLRNALTATFGLFVLYFFYTQDEIMLISPLPLLYITLKTLFPSSSSQTEQSEPSSKTTTSSHSSENSDSEGSDDKNLDHEETSPKNSKQESGEPVEHQKNQDGHDSRLAFIAIGCVLVYTLASQWYFPNKPWSKVRGTTLIISMKVVSAFAAYGCDMMTGIGYLLHPGTIIFGPWTSVASYKRDIEADSYNLFSVLSPMTLIVGSFGLVLSAVFLMLSTCVVPFLFQNMYPDPDDIDTLRSITGIRISELRYAYGMETPFIPMLFTTFQTALQFRFSWYYIAILSATLSIFSDLVQPVGFSSIFSVCNPFSIEIPRCLSKVCSDWNKNIAEWIRTYIFSPMMYWGSVKYGTLNQRRFFGLDPRHCYKLAILLFTYGISAAMHGFSLRIAAILVSLSVYTYVHHSLRKRLAIVFDNYKFAPLTGSLRTKIKELTDMDSYKFFSWRNFSGWIFQIMFVVLNFYHLAYLGGIMHEAEDLAIEDELQLTKAIWTSCNFHSLKIAGCLLLVYLFIR